MLPWQMLTWQLKSVLDVAMYLLLKFGQNWASNSWDIRWGFLLSLLLLGKVKPTLVQVLLSCRLELSLAISVKDSFYWQNYYGGSVQLLFWESCVRNSDCNHLLPIILARVLAMAIITLQAWCCSKHFFLSKYYSVTFGCYTSLASYLGFYIQIHIFKTMLITVQYWLSNVLNTQQ